MSNRKGFFLTLEGPEGSGKSTQARKIIAYLKKKRIPYVHTREPGGSFLGEAVRKILLNPKQKEVSPRAELLLYEGVRAQHVAEKIRPAVDAGKFVICERYSDATFAYQGYGRGLPMRALQVIDRFATERMVPDLTLLFDLDPDIGLQKAISSKREFQSKGDRMERAGIEFHRRVRHGYKKLAKSSRRIKIVSIADKSPAETFNIVKEMIEGAIHARKSKRRS